MVNLRPATEVDLPAIHRVWWATELASNPSEAVKNNPWFAHVIRTGAMLVAELDGQLVGFAGCRRLGDTSVISDFFVDPAHQGTGIGTKLLESLLPPDRPVMTLASDDPKAVSVYTRFGMTPRWKCHYVAGEPTRFAPGSLEIGEIDSYPVPATDLPHLQIDLGCTFIEIGQAGSSGKAAVADGSVESSWVAAEGGPVEVLTSALAWMAARGASKVEIQIGEGHAAFAVLVDAGFTVRYSDTFMASPGAEVPDPTRLTFNGDLLLVGE